MAAKLENLRVTKVDFVDEGANPRARIKLFKRHEPEVYAEDDRGRQEEKLVDSVMRRLADVLSGLFGKNGTDVPEEAEASVPEKAYGNLGDLNEKAKEQKGESGEMAKIETAEIDTAKMSPEDRAVFEALCEKYASEEEMAGSAGAVPESGEAEEGAEKKKDCRKAKSAEPEGGADIYKGLHPAVRAEIESLKKYREDAEEKELRTVAKKYEVIGKKADELVPALKSLKAAGGTAYDDMIGLLDSMVTAAEQCGMFSEIGKSREGGTDGADAIEKARVQARELRKTRPELTEAAALDEVLLGNPEIRREWDQ